MTNDPSDNEAEFLEDTQPNAIEEAVARYVDSLNDGESVDRMQVLLENPGIGHEVLNSLEKFICLNSETTRFSPLSTLGDYTLRRQIGRGGMGVVYEAWEGSMDRVVALKVLPGAVAADDKTFHRFMREAKTAGKLSHPNVVPVYAMGVNDNTPYYAMEYVEGETLAQILGKIINTDSEGETPFGKKDSVVYFAKLADGFADVADGLQHAHSKGVIHRDIKPSNLILDTDGHLRILDFGLAHLEGQESLTISGDLLGTVLYMSPEQARAHKIPIDHRSDVYSLGVTLYEMLTGKPPFLGKDHQDTLSQIIERDPTEPRKLNQRVPRDLEIIVLKCLRKDAGDRYGTAEALGQDLRRFVRGDPIEARAQPSWEKWQRIVARRKWGIAVSVLVLLLVGISALMLRSTAIENARIRQQQYEEQVRESLAHLLFLESTLKPELWSRFWGALPPIPKFLQQQASQISPEKIDGAFERAIQILPERPEAYYYRARALCLLDQTIEAVQVLERAPDDSLKFAPAAQFLTDLRMECNGLNSEKNRETSPPVASQNWHDSWRRAYRASEAKDWKGAEQAYSELIRFERPGNSLYLGSEIETRIGRGIALLVSGNYADAIHDFSYVRELWPSYLEPTLLLGKAWYLQGDTKQAEHIFRDLLMKQPSSQDLVRFWVMSVYKSVNDFDKAQGWAEDMEDQFLQLQTLVDIYFNQHKYDEAIKCGEQALNINDQDMFTTGMLGAAILLKHTKYASIDTDPEWKEKVIRLGKKAIELDSSEYLGYSILAAGYREKGELEKAEQLTKKVIDMNPQWVQGHIGLGGIYWRKKLQPEAVEKYKEAVDLAPDYSAAHSSFAYALDIMGDKEKALAHYEKAYHLDPRDPFPSFRIGYLFHRQTEFELAIAWFEKSIQASSDYFYSRLWISRSLSLVGSKEEALPHLVKAIKLRPQKAALHRELSYLLLENENLHQSVDWNQVLQRLMEFEDPQTAEPLHLQILARLWGYQRTKSGEKNALGHAQIAVEKSDRQDPLCLLTLGETLFYQDRTSEALAIIEEALALSKKTSRSQKFLEDRYSKFTYEVFPDLSSCAAINAAFEFASPNTVERLDLMGRLRGKEVNDHLLAYIQGCVLQDGGEYGKAADFFAQSLKNKSFCEEATLRHANCLRAIEDPIQAEAALRRGLGGPLCNSPELWKQWLVVCMHDIGMNPSETLKNLESIPIPEDLDNQPLTLEQRESAEWLLTSLLKEKNFRINCGSLEDFTDANGTLWSKDRFFVKGRPCYPSRGNSIQRHDEMLNPIYHTARVSCNERSRFFYTIPLPEGIYTVTLHFAEGWFRKKGYRYIKVVIEDEVELEDYDIYEKAGYASPDVYSYTKYIEDGLLDLEFFSRNKLSEVSAIEISRVEK